MKHLFSISIFAILVTLMGCKSNKTTENLVGAYTEYHKISQEEMDLFNNTYKGKEALKPQKVATQVVAGTNYSFLCKGNDNKTVEVVIYEPLPGQGKPEVSSISENGRR